MAEPVESGKNCIQCGECEEKCPYKLPIREMIVENIAFYERKVAPDLQGRVFSVRRMIAYPTTCIAYLIAGPLADNVLEPLLAKGGPLAGSIGQIIGTGPGRGIGLLYIIVHQVLGEGTSYDECPPP